MSFTAADLDDLLSVFRETYGEGKPLRILEAIRARHRDGQTRISKDAIIQEVWKEELAEFSPDARPRRIEKLRNTFNTHKAQINQRLLKLVDAGKNPCRIALVSGDVFGVVEDQAQSPRSCEETLGPLSDVLTEKSLRRLQRLWSWLQPPAASVDATSVIKAEAFRSHPALLTYLEQELHHKRLHALDRPMTLMRRTLGDQVLTLPVCLLWQGTDLRLTPFAEAFPSRKPDWQSDPYVRLRTAIGGKVKDNTTFSAARIQFHSSATLEITPGLTTYGSALATQDTLEWELLSGGARQWAEGRGQHPLELPLRSATESSANGDLIAAGRPHNALAISTLVVFRSPDGGHRVMIGKRSTRTGAHPDLFHVIPACMFQPEVGAPDVECDVLHNVLKEYGEELYSEQLDRKARDPRYFYTAWPSVRRLRRGLEDGTCVFRVTGLVLSLLNLRPEICTLLLIKDPAWWDDAPLRTNWEYAELQEVADTLGTARSDLNLATVETEFLDYFGTDAGLWVPPGLAALWLGIDAARAQLAT